MIRKDKFLQGVKSAVPIVLGYLPLGMAFGVLAKSGGLTTGQVAAMSILVYSGSGQLIAVGMLGAGAAAAGIITTIFLVNSRYLLLSASMAPYLKRLSSPFLAIAAHGITDETFAVGLSHFQKERADGSYLLGLFITAYLSWVTGSVAGAAVGNLVGDTARYGLDFALTAMFICLLMMMLKDRPGIMVAVLAGTLSVTFKIFIQSNWNIILATVIAATAGVVMQKWKKQSPRLYSERQ